ncbi:myelin regulatory factor-like protein isoform X2 [Adelges cooleyi]|uniref:myelin regulatory factor-like protein isoform X2 n=1 Tax=Adelges cooleyi TaxID=133065 RepID=UPI00217F5171|nr:myelin regulatory factor-like protein isoform X2 [Adelges cooleyi]
MANMEYTWTLLSNSDDQGLGNDSNLLNCNVQDSHPGQILILSNEPNAQPMPSPSISDMPNPLDKDYGTTRMHNAEPRKLHLMHSRSDFVGGIDHEALDFSHLTDEFIQNNNAEANQFFHESVDQSDHVMVRINNPYQQPPQLFLKNTSSIPPVVELPFDGTTVLPITGLSNKPAKDHKPQATTYATNSLPESPPDSEPPYSPADGVGQSPHRKTPNLQCLMSSNTKSQLSMNSVPPAGLYQKQQPIVNKLPHPLSVQPMLINQPGTSSHVTHLGFDQMPSSARDVEIQDVEYADLIGNAEKKRKLCPDAGSSVRVKKESESGGKKVITHVSPSGRSVCSEDSYTYQDSCESGLYADTSFQCIRFQPFQESSWNILCDHSLKELPMPHYRVDADKGFNFSNIDDAFVCQKKNHFQITCHTQLQGDAQFVRTAEGIHKVGSFQLHFYGVKVESPSQTIKVEQSQSDRSKKAFHPVLLDLREEQVSKVTVGRLHFSETTCNNMRKKGKPNPDQRYFYLVVGLHAHCINDHDYPIISYASERIIVRVIQASNPGQFESDAELCWQRGTTPESIVHTGKVGINTDRPDESLVIHGNVKLTGHIIQPSDVRIKQDIQRCDTSEQLKNVQKINVVQFSYKPEFSSMFGLSLEQDTGIIAQEVQAVLPEAVTNTGEVSLSNGDVYDDFLVVNKDRIFMENVGAVKELSKITSHLEARICKLEQNNKLRSPPKKKVVIAMSDLSAAKCSEKLSNASGENPAKDLTSHTSSYWSDLFVKFALVTLSIVIACCLISILYLVFTENYYSKNPTPSSKKNVVLSKPPGIKPTQSNAHARMETVNEVPPEIGWFLDKENRMGCLLLKRPVTNNESCEYTKVKSKMTSFVEKPSADGNELENYLSFIVTVDRIPDVTYKDVMLEVFFGNGTDFSPMTDNDTMDRCGKTELHQCSDKSEFVYGFQLPATKSLTEYFIRVSYRLSKGNLDGCTPSMVMSMSCPNNPYANLATVNGSRWTPTATSPQWPTDKFSVSDNVDSVAVIVRYKPWSLDRIQTACKHPAGKQTVALIEYNVSLHKVCDNA